MTLAHGARVTTTIEKDEKISASQVKLDDDRADVRLHNQSLALCQGRTVEGSRSS